ncbi:hypothetical protein CK203_102078 [Vitis vinifera]|uniref:Retrotransposon gag domain-containing protein n=1 Tax=Vitis vinifera TaxID=29760 RepID=A0A438EJS5_VITVI|nr:hypothetical protein CK203_102078 [Vitis vinifera]
MPKWIRDCGGRLVKLETPHNKELEINEGRMHPPRMSAPSCIVPPTEQLVIRPHIVPLLPTFHGMESENYAHIKEFEDVCNTFREGGASIDLMRLKLFPFTLKDKAKIWLNSLRPRSIRTWTDLQAEFLKKYMEAINACPHHGFDTWLLVSYFYDGMSSSMKQLLETMCGGDFMSKNPEEAMDFLSYVAEVSRGWDERTEENYDKKSGGARTEKIMKCKLLLKHQCNWRNHPNFSWKPRAPQYQQPAQPSQPSQQASSLEQAIVNLSKKIDNLQYSISRLTNLNTVQEKGRFPSQPHQNPKGIHEVETHEGESSQVRDVKALITLRSGKKVESPTPKPYVEEKEEEETKKREEMKGKKKDISEEKEDRDSTVNANPEKELIKEELMKKRTSPPFPQALHGKKGIKNASEILEVLSKGLNVNKKAFLTEQVSAIIQCKSPLKYKDPGCPTISVMIGGKVVEKALLDLGASVNLLPYSVYKQLGLGELKPTSITLSLADRSVKIPRGIIEDVLVQVDNFYYPVDFVVLDTDPLVKEANYVPIILGRPFLATSNAIINCRNGLMQLTFGNMTLELNIFHMSKKLITPEEEEGPKRYALLTL